MARIKGIELRNIVQFRGHEQEELIQGNVYYNGTKVGFYSQDSWGGDDIFQLDSKLSKKKREEIENITNNYVGGVLFKKIDDLCGFNSPHWEQIGYDYLFMDLLLLLGHEKTYKEYCKKWNTNKVVIIYENSYNVRICSDLKEEDKNKLYFIYNSLEDFIIE